ncbi:hypothetical protein BSNT_08601 [Bacillus subtilis subsp. natto BEST195]|nr:hypothetical protein BSNT_08601 [Bacillus subtilis subsp. natto BEST195]
MIIYQTNIQISICHNQKPGGAVVRLFYIEFP